MKLLFTAFILLCTSPFYAQSVILPADIQIKTAELAAPEMLRQNATVLGYNAKGELVTLRKGSNSVVCLADDPKLKGIKVACYGKELEPFMARGRELIREGKTEEEKQKIRGEEINSKKLKMPSEPSVLYVVTGKDEDYNPATGELKNFHIRYVFYKPYMTAEATGLSTKPQAPGMPWLMDAGTQHSHIMITPPKN